MKYWWVSEYVFLLSLSQRGRKHTFLILFFSRLFNLFRFSSSVTQSPELHLGILVIGLDPRNKRTEVLHSDANRTGRSHVRSRRCYYISFMFLNHLNLSLRCSETENAAAPNEYFNNFELGIPNLKFTNLDEFGMILGSPIFGTQFQEKPGSSAASGAPNVHLAIGPGNCFAQRRWDSDFSNDLFWFKNGKTPGPKGSKRPQKGMNTFLANSRKSQEIPSIYIILHHRSGQNLLIRQCDWGLPSSRIENWRIPNCHQVMTLLKPQCLQNGSIMRLRTGSKHLTQLS